MQEGGREPREKHLLASHAEKEEETGWDPYVDLKDVFSCFTDIFVKKVSVHSSLFCVSSNLTMNNVWQCSHVTVTITGQVAVAIRITEH